MQNKTKSITAVDVEAYLQGCSVVKEYLRNGRLYNRNISDNPLLLVNHLERNNQISVKKPKKLQEFFFKIVLYLLPFEYILTLIPELFHHLNNHQKS
jgi:hypothetical protein